MSVNLNLFKKLFNSFLNLCRKPKFVLGMTYVFGVSTTSLLYGIFQGDKVDRKMVFRDENDVLHGVPHEPGFFLLGSDYHGFSVLDMLLVGAKYTIIFTILIALLQILLGYLLTIPYMFWLGERSKNVINKVADGMQFLPITLLAYILLLETVVFSEKNKAVAESLVVPNIVLQVAVITLLSLPIMLNSLGNEANSILKKEHIQSSILLGASKSHVFFKHITTHLKPKIILLFYQQLIRVLVVFVHLGVFGIFLGGGIRVSGKPPTSLTYEWTSLFANLRDGIITGQYWVVYPVLILYLLLIFSFQAISKSLIEEEQQKVGAYSERMM